MNPNKEKNRAEDVEDHLLDRRALEVDRHRQEVRRTEELNIHQMMRMILLNIEINQKVPKSQK